MITQTLKVLEHLKKHHSITSWEAIQKYRITRLSAKIFDLRESGYDIRSIYETNEETGTRYARYVLVKSRKWTEDDLLDLSKDDFLSKYDVAEEEYEILHKQMQEM